MSDSFKWMNRLNDWPGANHFINRSIHLSVQMKSEQACRSGGALMFCNLQNVWQRFAQWEMQQKLYWKSEPDPFTLWHSSTAPHTSESHTAPIGTDFLFLTSINMSLFKMGNTAEHPQGLDNLHVSNIPFLNLQSEHPIKLQVSQTRQDVDQSLPCLQVRRIVRNWKKKSWKL